MSDGGPAVLSRGWNNRLGSGTMDQIEGPEADQKSGDSPGSQDTCPARTQRADIRFHFVDASQET